jgi:hypothetical protein
MKAIGQNSLRATRPCRQPGVNIAISRSRTSPTRDHVGTWMAARAESPDLTETEIRDALGNLDPHWDLTGPNATNIEGFPPHVSVNRGQNSSVQAKAWLSPISTSR